MLVDILPLMLKGEIEIVLNKRGSIYINSQLT